MNTSLLRSGTGATSVRGKRPLRVSVVAASLGVVAALSSVPGIAGHDAIASLYIDDKLAARAKFVAGGDNFKIVKHSTADDYNRAYVEFHYIRKDGTTRNGSRWGVNAPGEVVTRQGPNFGEGRKVAIRVCLQEDYWPDPCGPWEVGYA